MMPKLRTQRSSSRILILSSFPILMFLLMLGAFGSQPQAAQAQPLRDEVSGNITTTTTWTVANSPYTLTGNVTVNAGVTLTIEPGVVVKGQSNAELKVLGRLESMGTAEQPITFTSATDTGPYEWSGLVFDGDAGDLRYVTVRYGGYPNSVIGGNQGSNLATRNVLTGQVRLENSRILSETNG